MSIISLKAANTRAWGGGAQKQTKYCKIKDLKAQSGFCGQNPTM
ncbi:hypothetical protein predicted by Glimmer/Critica [Bdellovibrio bacteriovorus HD100]|uniref:Uncharacterized protein n=1 Tax=Bdellovibrio bacteriovorus (strain ATCC 15356 / DSM 50701 / NCIMB 9529 / HD100) TaxID=264462 RepID=Q6MN65_BDEBA|nr:hypothetical protein predicted by Glimmer/Critica [Bdellovibrio bacteriovorus HD100]